MGHYPAWPGSQSYLRVACIFNHSTAGSGDFVSSTFTIHDFANVRYHNGAARTITNTALIPLNAVNFIATDCTAMAAFVNRSITTVGGVAGIATRTFVTNVGPGCQINLNKAVTAPLGIPAGTSFLVENSSVRAVADATVQAGTPQVCSPNANFTAADTGLSVDGTLIPPGTTITVNPSAANCVDLNNAPTGPGVNQVITIGGTLDGGTAPTATASVSTTRTVNDGVVAAGPPNTITSNAARFVVTDIGLRVSGAGIAPACYIAARTNTVATLAPAGCAPANPGPYTFTIGDPSATAPTSTDTVLNQGVQLPLNPALVPGQPPCTADTAAGFGIEGTWLNPGSFIGGAFATQPPGTRAIGEILFKTAVITYGAFVLEIPAAPIGTDPTIGAYHFNLAFPNVPTGLALCASTATSPGLGFSVGVNATTASAAAIPTGQGRPASAQLRSTTASTVGSTTTMFITDDVNGGGVKWVTPDFNRTCIIPAGPPVINFVCGDG